jgi:hypothetical protein
MYNGYRVSLREYRGRGVALTTHPPSSAEVKEIVELYLYSTSGPFYLYFTNILVCGKLAWEKSMDVMQDRLRDDDDKSMRSSLKKMKI